MRQQFAIAAVVSGLIVIGSALQSSCSNKSDTPAAPSPTSVNAISDDASLYRFITDTEPFRAYTAFPNAAEITSGTLNGSSAHQPLVRVSMNATALGALQNGRLPAGTKFPDGSVIVKDVRSSSGVTNAYTVIYKSSASSLAGNGWLWAEFRPDGSVAYSIRNRGTDCVSCHSREQGPQNDFVRTFERQR